jgi:hypothetical protein
MSASPPAAPCDVDHVAAKAKVSRAETAEGAPAPTAAAPPTAPGDATLVAAQEGVTGTIAVPVACAAGDGAEDGRILRWPKGFSFFVDRYYDHYLVENARGIPGNHLRLMRHSNGLAVVCLDPSHALLVEARRTGIAPRVTFDLKKNSSDRQNVTAGLKGKRKKQAILVMPETTLLAAGPGAVEGASAAASNVPSSKAEAAESETFVPWYKVLAEQYPYRVCCCIQGSLLEQNMRITEEPHLLVSQPLTAGFVAVLHPRHSGAKVVEGLKLLRQSLASADPLHHAGAAEADE